MSNLFWKDVLCSVTLFMQGALFCNPKKIFTAPFWDNLIIQQNNKAIKKTSFAHISTKIKTISDFYYPGTSQLYSKEQFESRHNLKINNEDFVELKYIIKLSYKSLGLHHDHNICTFLPAQPLLLSILRLTKKGCNIYSKLLKKKSNLNRTQTKSESKWHRELDCTFGIEFWNSTYSLAASKNVKIGYVGFNTKLIETAYLQIIESTSLKILFLPFAPYVPIVLIPPTTPS